MRASCSTPAKVVAHPGWVDLLHEPLELLEVLAIGFFWRADAERDPVKNHGIAFAKRLQVIKRFTPSTEEVFADDFEKTHRGGLIKYVAVMGNPQTCSHAKIWNDQVTGTLLFL